MPSSVRTRGWPRSFDPHFTIANVDRSAEEIFGSIDAVKLRSFMTLFHRAGPDEAVFAEVLQRFYAGVEDNATIAGLGA